MFSIVTSLESSSEILKWSLTGNSDAPQWHNPAWPSSEHLKSTSTSVLGASAFSKGARYPHALDQAWKAIVGAN
eukprot:5698222-Amphidinium_carterae.1